MSGIVSDISKKVKQVDRKQLFLLFLIFVLAFGVRGHLLKYDYMFGFDSYYHARMAGELLETGIVPEVDPSAYYFVEGGVGPPRKPILLASLNAARAIPRATSNVKLFFFLISSARSA